MNFLSYALWKMKLSTHTDYGLRVLMQVCAAPEGVRITIDDVATGYGISRSHLTKVVQNLGVHGFLQNTRGRSGGLQLARAAEDISLGEVVRALEATQALVECHQQDGQCVVAPACGLKHVLLRAQHAFFAVLDEYTLQDLVRAPKPFFRLLRSTG